jgi:hypothetical protein
VSESLLWPGPGQSSAVPAKELYLLADVVGVPDARQDLAVQPSEPARGWLPGLDERDRLGQDGQDDDRGHEGFLQ